jgi:hypothetical protein
MLSRQDVKKQFLHFLSLTSLSEKEHIYLSSRRINFNEIDEFIRSSDRIKIITNLKKISFPGWLGVVYCLRKGKQYDVYFLSSSGEISLVLMAENIEELETKLAPISDWNGVKNNVISELNVENFTQTMPSIRFPPKEEKIECAKSYFKMSWEKYRETVERIFVGFLTIGLTILTWQMWFHWLVALGVFLSFCYLQINFENQKLNPQTSLQNYLYLYGKEMCWIVFFIATQSYSGLLSPFLTMMYAPYRGLEEKIK